MGGIYRYLIHIEALPGVTDVLGQARDALIAGAKADNGRVVSVYKILGENGILVVIEGGIEGAIDLLTKTVGPSVKFTTKSLRAYENFAKNVLEVDESLCEIGNDTLPTENRQLFWLDFDVQYRGLTQEQLMSSWKKEATFALSGRKAGQLDIVLYKVVAERKVEVFWSQPDGDAVDDASFALPIFQEMGDNITMVCKPIKPF